jgi:hypothetical protein
MKPVIVSLVLAMSVLGGATSAALAEDCKVTGWTDGLTARPIFKCPDDENSSVRAQPRHKGGSR